jgi:hypothetical protein
MFAFVKCPAKGKYMPKWQLKNLDFWCKYDQKKEKCFWAETNV